MTGSRVLVARVPRPVENIDKCTERLKRGLRDGILILGADVQYSIEEFPPLGAVEVVAGDVSRSDTEARPRGRRAQKRPAGEADAPPAPAVTPAPPEAKAPSPDAAPAVTVFRSTSGEPPRETASAWRLPMSAGEIVSSYKHAAKPRAQIKVLADLNACSRERIEEILRSAGEELPDKGGRPRKVREAHE